MPKNKFLEYIQFKFTNSHKYIIDHSVLIFSKLKSRVQSLRFSLIKLALLVLLVVSFCMILVVPMVPSENVKVSNNIFYSNEDLSPALSSLSNENISILDILSMYHKLTQISFIESVKISYVPPEAIYFVLKENYPTSHVNFLGTYFYIDTYGRVLEVSNAPKYINPQIINLDVSSISLNKALPLSPQKLSILNSICNSLVKFKLLKDVSTVDITDLQNIRLSISDLQILLGNIDQVDEKIQWLSKIKTTHSSGYLDLTRISQGISTIYP